MRLHSLSKGGNWPRNVASGRQRGIVPTWADVAAYSFILQLEKASELQSGSPSGHVILFDTREDPG